MHTQLAVTVMVRGPHQGGVALLSVRGPDGAVVTSASADVAPTNKSEPQEVRARIQPQKEP